MTFLALVCLAAASSSCAGTDARLKRGDELSKTGLFEEALEEYRKAAGDDPEDPVLAARIAKTKTHLAEGANSEGLEKIESGDAYSALLAFKRAIAFDPGNPGYETNLKKAALHRMADGNKAIEQKRYADAITVFKELLAELPRMKQAGQGLKDAQESWANVLLRQAGKYQEHGLYGNALIELIKLRKMSGAFGDSAEREVVSRKNLALASVFGFQVRPARVKRRLVAGTAQLVQRLQQAPLEGCACLGTSEEPQALLTVGLQSVELDTGKSASTGRRKYQSGTRPVDNPAFGELEKLIETARERIAELEQMIEKDQQVVEQMRQSFADAGPDDDDRAMRARLKKAEKALKDHREETLAKGDLVLAKRNELSDTPRKLDEPVYDEHEYQIYEVTRTASVRMVLDAVSDDEQVLVRSAEFEATASTTDKTNKADSRYGIEADPLQLPRSDDELVDEAYAAAVKQAAGRIGDLFKRWQGEILERARQASSGAELEAIEDYVLYLCVSRGEPPADLVRFLKEKRDFEDIEALRGRK